MIIENLSDLSGKFATESVTFSCVRGENSTVFLLQYVFLLQKLLYRRKNKHYNKRVKTSSDGLIFVTYDHYKTFYEVY